MPRCKCFAEGKTPKRLLRAKSVKLVHVGSNPRLVSKKGASAVFLGKKRNASEKLRLK
jgi:hypothetical protein